MRNSAATEPAVTTIVFVHRGDDWIRGSEQCLLDLVSGLDRQRYRPVVVCEQPALIRAVEALGVSARQLPSEEDWGLADPTVRRRRRRRIRRLLEDEGAGLVHVNATRLVPLVLPAALRLQIPLVTHVHLPITDSYARRHEWLHQGTVTVGVANHVLDPLRGDGVLPEKLCVIRNGVDGKRMLAGTASSLRCELGIPGDAWVAGSVSSLIERKAHDVSIRAVGIARDRGTSMHLILIGSGPEEARLRELTKTLGLTDVVHFVGYRAEAGAILRDAVDCLLSVSLEETLGLSVLEAQWLGLPVILSDLPAHREAILDEHSALFTAVGDEHSTAAALQKMSSEPCFAVRAREITKSAAQSEYALARYIAEFETLYESLLARARREFGIPRALCWPPVYNSWLKSAVVRRLGFR